MDFQEFIKSWKMIFPFKKLIGPFYPPLLSNFHNLVAKIHLTLNFILYFLIVNFCSWPYVKIFFHINKDIFSCGVEYYRNIVLTWEKYSLKYSILFTCLCSCSHDNIVVFDMLRLPTFLKRLSQVHIIWWLWHHHAHS